MLEKRVLESLLFETDVSYAVGCGLTALQVLNRGICWNFRLGYQSVIKRKRGDKNRELRNFHAHFLRLGIRRLHHRSCF